MSTRPAQSPSPKKVSAKRASKLAGPIHANLFNIFDEFTGIISGELKSMNLEQFEAENPPKPSS
ncbi:hypothetical protein [Vampirovibrio chlorellavorus]|uniref:hypothetical protein n=1 Tax=Vampirovibrio chlorellavorus TaxID=758823 RepID=UPI0026EB1889|nr:hypothetical protein [Vampirovibrio chlorellavorus]